MYITIPEFIEEWNYQCQNAEEQDENTLDELFVMVGVMMRNNCGIEGDLPAYTFINKKAQIKLVEGN